MCMFYGDIQPGADTDAIADRLKQEFLVQLEALPPVMAELLMALGDQPAPGERK